MEWTNIDQTWVPVVVGNPYTVMAILAILKALAKLTPSTQDDKIATMLCNGWVGLKGMVKKK